MTTRRGEERASDRREADSEESRHDGQDRDHQFRALVDAVEEYAIFRLDRDGFVRSWNAGAERIKGYSADDIVGEHFSTFYTEGDRDEGIPGRNLAIAAENGSTEDEGWRVRADGSRFWANVTITAIRDEDGTLEGFSKVTRDMTERRRRERQIARRKNELETELGEILGRISDGFYALDSDFEFTHVNERAEALLQHSRDELLGRSVWDIIPNTGESVSADRFVDSLECQEPATYEEYIDSLDAWFEFNVYPSETGLSVYFRDITGYKERQRELEQYERIVETVDDGIYVLDEHHRFSLVNGGFVSISGYGADELIGEHAEKTFGEKFVELANEKQAEIEVGDRDIAVLEEELHRADGTSIVVESRFGLFEFEAGKWGRVGVVRDVSDRVERERALEESERRYRTLVEHFPNGAVALVDEDLRYQTVGGDPIIDDETSGAELVGHRVAEVLPSALADLLVPAYEAALGGQPRSFEGTIDDRIYRFHIVPVRDTEGAIFAALGMSQDITAIKRYERRLEESNERLEQFAYIASHDLQEPLRTISNFLQLLEDRHREALDAEAREFIDFTIDAAVRMRDMIDDLLKYSRIDSGDARFESTDCIAVIDRVLDQLHVQIEETDAEVVVDELPTVTADENQLEQVFQNLISNAIKYRGDEPPRIEIDAARRGTTWEFRVSDNGIGIDPDRLDQVFEVFKRLHTHEEYSGTGIGLALCEKIVDRHGGRIWAESEPGSGTTFFFTLPAGDARSE